MQCFPTICGSGSQRNKLGASDDWTIEKTQTKLSQAIFDPEKHPPEVQEALAFVSNGGSLTKVRSKRSQLNRFFKVENGVMFIYIDSQKNGFQSRTKDQSKAYIQKIQEIQEGMESSVFTEAFQGSHKAPESCCCFTIVFMGGDRTMDLVAPDESTRNLWVTGLRHLAKFMKEGDPATVRSLFLQHQFQKADVDGNGSLDRTEILRLLKHMNVSVEEDYAREIWQMTTSIVSVKTQPGLSAEPQRMKPTKKDLMTLEEFAVFCELLEKQEEIDELFRRYDNGTGKLTVDDLSEFWKKEQQEELNTEEIQRLIQSCEACPDFKEKHLLSLPGFHAMVRSEWMNVCCSRCRKVYQDMDQPLCHYFISASHNTYLSDDQLKGPSKVDCYVRALKMGCRCVELDSWNGSEGQPVIYHGYTLTPHISFRDVITAINQHAFETSEFPVILSIENHCSIDQQKIMAEDMRSIFGSKLLLEPLPDDSTCLPSPNELKGKIIVKCKKLPAAAAVVPEEVEEVSDEDEAAEMPDEQVKEEVEKSKQEKGSKKRKLAQELSDCVVICQSISFKSFKQAKEKSNFRHMSSLEETKALDLVEDESDDFLQHNTWQLSRIYPKGTRMNSTNFYPQPLWQAGCQIVALNCQTHDTPMLMNRGMFEDNGRCGFVLKPEFMRDESILYKPNGPYPSEWKRKLTIKVISGYQLPKPVNQKESSVLDPFVKINICGIPSDIQNGRTKTIDDKGFHPVWNEEFEFVVSCPDLAVVLFRVYDNEERRRDIIVAQYGLPMNALATGYRTVHLKTLKGDPLTTGSLFVHVTITPECSNPTLEKFMKVGILKE